MSLLSYSICDRIMRVMGELFLTIALCDAYYGVVCPPLRVIPDITHNTKLLSQSVISVKY